MILLTGATGQLGGRVLAQLRQMDTPLRVLTRDPSKLTDTQDLEVVAGNYRDRSSLDNAFEGVTKAFIVSIHEPPMERALLHKNAFEAAARAGVEYVVYTSFQGAASDCSFNMGRDHHQSEQYLLESGLHFTALRNSFYMDIAHHEVNDGLIRNPAGDGRVAWVSRDDIADLIIHLLQHPRPTSESLNVTGPEAPRLSELAALLSELSGRTIHFQHESYEEGLAWRKAYGLEGWNLDAWMSSDIGKGKGENAVVALTIEYLLGRKPLSLRAFYTRYPSLLDNL